MSCFCRLRLRTLCTSNEALKEGYNRRTQIEERLVNFIFRKEETLQPENAAFLYLLRTGVIEYVSFYFDILTTSSSDHSYSFEVPKLRRPFGLRLSNEMHHYANDFGEGSATYPPPQRRRRPTRTYGIFSELFPRPPGCQKRRPIHPQLTPPEFHSRSAPMAIMRRSIGSPFGSSSINQ